MPLLTLKAQIHATPEVEAVLKEAMRSATKVYNGLLWHLREEYKKTGKVDLSRKNLNRILKELPRAKDYHSMSVQLTREEVREAYKAFFALRKEGKTNHQAPGFRRKGYLSPLRYVQSGYKVEGDRVTVSLGTNGGTGYAKSASASPTAPECGTKGCGNSPSSTTSSPGVWKPV
jgi:putative transposase